MDFNGRVELFTVKYNMEDKRFNKYLPKQQFLHTAFYYKGYVYDYVPKIEGGFRCMTPEEFKILFPDDIKKYEIENNQFEFNHLKFNLNSDEVIEKRIREIDNLYKMNQLHYSFYKVQCTSVALYILCSEFSYFIDTEINKRLIMTLFNGMYYKYQLKIFLIQASSYLINPNPKNKDMKKFLLFLSDNIEILFEQNIQSGTEKVQNMIHDAIQILS